MALEILSKGRPFRVHCSCQRKKKREKSFFKYLRHEGLRAFKPLHLKDIPENNLNTCLVYTYGMGGSRGFKPLGLNRGSSSKCQTRKLLKDLPIIYVEEGSKGP